jgi:uncharacterized membrane protein
MTEFQERRLLTIERRIKSHENTKDFFKKNWYVILVISIFIAVLVYFMTKIAEMDAASVQERRINLDMVYAYSFGTFCFIILAALLGHILFNIQLSFLIKRLQNDKDVLLKIVKKDKLEFKRFEHFDEIGDED